MGFKPSKKHSLERVDVNGNYEPSNCVWATQTEQARNKTTTLKLTHNGQTKTIAEWAVETGIKYRSLVERVYNGWSDDDVLTIPINSSKDHIKYKELNNLNS